MQGTVTATFTLSFIINCVAFPPANFPAITPVRCENQVTKESGVCMFYWSCTHVAHGVHIASCMDRFLIGSCCKLPHDAQAYTSWFFGKVASQLSSSEKRHLQKEDSEVASRTVPEITSVYFYELQNEEDIENKEVMTPNNPTATTSKEYYLGSGSQIHININSNKTSPQNTDSLMSLLPPVFEQPNRTIPMNHSLSLHKPVFIDLTHNIRTPVNLEPSHDIRTPVDPEPSHNVRVPVDSELYHDIRVPVNLESYHDIRKPVTVEKSHDLRNPLSQVNYYDMKIHELNKSIENGVLEMGNNFETESSIMIENTSFAEKTSFNGNLQVSEISDISDEVLSKSSTENVEHVYKSFTYTPDENETKIFENSVKYLSTTPESSQTEKDFKFYFSSTVPPVRHFSTFSYSSDYLTDTSTSSIKTREAECGISPRYPSGRIIGGHKTKYLKWPWMISLQHLEKNRYRHQCGAILLNRMWAATVAHCVDKKLPNEVILIVGDYNLHTTEEFYSHKEMRVYLIVMHPDFNPHTFENDLALLRFYQPVPNQVNIAPICLPGPGIDLNGRIAVVTGWGKLAEDGELPGYLQEVHIPIVPNEECQAMYIDAGYLENIPESFICAGRVEGGVDSCEGDSGGPMVIKGNHGQWLLIGLISWGIECGSPRLPGVYTRVPKFVEWIKKFITI